VDYWDQDHDGIIWPQDTYMGCRAWGWSIPLALLATFIINVNLSYPTVSGLLPDPFFRIYTTRLYKDKHGSDSMTYDNEGRFKPQNFEDIFAKYDKGNKGGLDFSDLLDFWKGQRMVFDFFGWSASFFECERLQIPWELQLTLSRGSNLPVNLAGGRSDAQGGHPGYLRWQHLLQEGRCLQAEADESPPTKPHFPFPCHQGRDGTRGISCQYMTYSAEDSR